MPVMVARKRTRGASQGAARPSWGSGLAGGENSAGAATQPSFFSN